jgi:transcription initiation factor TFIID TATA-box-binding protein
MDINSHPMDPRFQREESSTYIPQPFAAYITSLQHFRNKGTMKNINFRAKYNINNPQEDMSYWIENNPYLFAMLCGLRSMCDDVQEVDNINKILKNIKNGDTSSSSSNYNKNDDDDDDYNTYENSFIYKKEKNKKYKKKKQKQQQQQRKKKDMVFVWDGKKETKMMSLQVVRKSIEIHGPPVYKTSPYDRFDLVELNNRLHGRAAKCIPTRFAAVILKFKYPTTSVSIFSPGKIVCTGARTNLIGHYVIIETISLLRKHGFSRCKPLGGSLCAQNVVATIEHPFEIDTKKLCENYPDICSFKATFPGTTVRPPQIHPAAQLAFESGKIVTMGGRSKQDLMRALSATFPIYYSVRKEKENKVVIIEEEEEEKEKEKEKEKGNIKTKKRKKNCLEG